MTSPRNVCVYGGDALARYGFGHGHPFDRQRMAAFLDELEQQQLDQMVMMCEPVLAQRSVIEQFHTPRYVDQVKTLSISGSGYLDQGDTPAFPGIYEAAAYVVGTTLDAIAKIIHGECGRGFVPIAGLHHASRDHAAGFCVFNDCGIAIEVLRSQHQLKRVAYVDIDAHHGDGVFYGFEQDPELLLVDIHEDGRFLYPGTGSATESGRGKAKGTKLNIPMRPGADDQEFLEAWRHAEAFLAQACPEFILFQCGADSVAGDPITHLSYSPASHHYAAQRLCQLAERCCQGRILALGGGGYNHHNLAKAWTAVVHAFVNTPARN